jgi:hypothetical protein
MAKAPISTTPRHVHEGNQRFSRHYVAKLMAAALNDDPNNSAWNDIIEELATDSTFAIEHVFDAEANQAGPLGGRSSGIWVVTSVDGDIVPVKANVYADSTIDGKFRELVELKMQERFYRDNLLEFIRSL